jgi:hypothetical protein
MTFSIDLGHFIFSIIQSIEVSFSFFFYIITSIHRDNMNREAAPSCFWLGQVQPEVR